MFRLAKTFSAMGLAVAFCSTARGLDVNQDPTKEDYFFASGMGIPVQNREKVFEATTKRANSTSFEGLENVEVKDSKLTFTLAGSGDVPLLPAQDQRIEGGESTARPEMKSAAIAGVRLTAEAGKAYLVR